MIYIKSANNNILSLKTMAKKCRKSGKEGTQLILTSSIRMAQPQRLNTCHEDSLTIYGISDCKNKGYGTRPQEGAQTGE